MFEVFLKTLPFFGLIGLGWLSSRIRFFPPEGAAWLTRFVFWFALSAMLFRFAAGLDLGAIFDGRFVMAYLTGSLAVWAVAMAAGRWRGLSVPEAAMEAQCCMIGNTGFLGVPMLVVLLGPDAVGPVLMVLIIDTIVFATLITLIVHAARSGGVRPRTLRPILRGIASNPMILSMAAGLAWAGAELPMPRPLDEFLSILGAAATPGALFAIGASLAGLRLGRVAVSGWLGAAKLVLHPLAVWIAARAFGVDPFAAGVMVAAAALPVAGNVYILAQHFGLAEQRTSAAILISTAISIATIPLVMTLIGG
ncbi:AEC family transporter [Paracoccus sp. 1_MG-2023]|uniref:AEC family transporter n=1 Tax=unclassified Paracoccus (in: a-proteobacteria) TaxID=2688777 RepID=UPI001C08D98E|nr:MULTISPECIES: AEC family transporter [unclassified Paracoccus (in: a-proteobacteria)]MBU2957342.1 AEC family transporter [Paracoccus sp. C2R09]MDO6670104.1 AEC family transporter [Paracoccus sp. 1_MG-2023]